MVIQVLLQKQNSPKGLNSVIRITIFSQKKSCQTLKKDFTFTPETTASLHNKNNSVLFTERNCKNVRHVSESGQVPYFFKYFLPSIM